MRPVLTLRPVHLRMKGHFKPIFVSFLTCTPRGKIPLRSAGWSSPPRFRVGSLPTATHSLGPEFGGCFAFYLVRGGLGVTCFHYIAGVGG